MKPDWNRLKIIALAEIEAMLTAMPKPLSEQAQKLPLTFELRPNEDLQTDGIELDTLGIFTGSGFASEPVSVMPPQIILFLGNLWDYADGDEQSYAEEIRTTYLHELGHFLGLDEDGLNERGLE